MDTWACTEVHTHCFYIHIYFNYKLFVSSLGSAVNILLVTPEKAIKLTANDAFRYVLLNKQGYIEAGSLLIFERRILNVVSELIPGN